MTKRILLFTAFAGITALTLSSYDNGPFAGGAGNRTGSAGSTANCSTGGCHSANTTNTSVVIAVTSGGFPVTKYLPGATYTVMVSGANTTANLPKYGFQLSSVLSANTSTQAGTFSGVPSGVAIRTSGSLQLVEHSSPLSGTGSGTNWVYSSSFSWKAPAAGSGAVKFFLTLNAVNGNGATSGDQPNTGTLTLSEIPAGIAEVSGNINVTAYPNPATDRINIKMTDVANGEYTLGAYDMNGKKVAAETLHVTSGNLETALSSQSWAAGIYHIRISKDGAEKLIAVVKQ